MPSSSADEGDEIELEVDIDFETYGQAFPLVLMLVPSTSVV